MSAEDRSGRGNDELPPSEPKINEEEDDIEEQPEARRRTSSFKRNDPDIMKARAQARQSASASRSHSHSGSTSPTVATQPLPGTSLSPGQKLTTLPGTSANYATSSLENMKVSPGKSSPAKSSPSRSPKGPVGRRLSSVRDEPLEVVEEEEEPKSPPKTSFEDFRPFNAASVSRELGASQRSSDDSKASSGDTIEEETSTRMVDEGVSQKLADLAASQASGRQIPRIVLPEDEEEEQAGPSEPSTSSPPMKAASKRKSMTAQQNLPKKSKGRGEQQVADEESPRSGMTTRSAARSSKHDESEQEGQ